MKDNKLNRRSALKTFGLAAGAAIVSPISYAAESKKADFKKPKKSLTIAHITDVHMRPEHNAPNRFRQCIKDIKKHKVDFFLNGGDTIYAADYGHITRERTNEQWKIWQELRSEISEYEVHSCLGNHDMWWAAPSKEDEMYGKNYVVKQLKTPNRYYSFDKQNWHFVILDSNNKNAGSLDEEQRKWLENDLSQLKKGSNVLFLTHYPIIGVNGGSHKDRKYITKLFYQHKDKNLTCLSGHVHLLDSVVYNNVNYFCNGALSGFWWEDGNEESGGKYWVEETPPGYAIVELFDNGLVKNTYYPHPY
jgi:3',5'-cyclic AMP phosphodiesterase CpdA